MSFDWKDMKMGLLRPRVQVVAFALVLTQLSAAWAAEMSWKQRREVLGERQTIGAVRIHYTLQGTDAVADPAMMLELAKQFQRADQFYTGTLGLVPPTKNMRYPGLGAMDVHLLNMEDNMGTAGDAALTYHYRTFRDNTPALSISISTRWRPSNLTPEHELFHAYQYGYTFFKNAWYLEGMARSMENVFRKQDYVAEPLPSQQSELDALLRRSYGASGFWNRMMQLCTPGCPVATVAQPAQLSFRPKQGEVCDSGLIKTLLEEFRIQDRRAASARGLNAEDWPEREQKSATNNPWLLAGLARTMEKRCPVQQEPELSKFYELVKGGAAR